MAYTDLEANLMNKIKILVAALDVTKYVILITLCCSSFASLKCSIYSPQPYFLVRNPPKEPSYIKCNDSDHNDAQYNSKNAFSSVLSVRYFIVMLALVKVF
jgi:hypothetical protein